MYYAWFEDSPKLTTEMKIQDAIDAYIRRFGKRPNTVLVNEADVTAIQGMIIRPEHFIRRNNFWVGWESNGQAVLPVVEKVTLATAEPAPVAKRATRKTAKLAA